MIVESNSSFSPNSYKGRLCVEQWQKDKLPISVRGFSKISSEALYLAHSKEYVDGVLAGTLSNGYGSTDLAIAKSLPFVVSSIVEATLHSFMSGEASVSPTGGFHHAGYDEGHGFCTFNGLIVAAQMAHQLGAKKIGICDLDQHEGDGTRQIIKRLKLEYIHHYTSGEDEVKPEGAEHWLKELRSIIYQFENCDVVLYQAGADSSIHDPLGGYLTDEQMIKRDEIVFETLRKLGVPVAWCFAGGYQRDENGSLWPVVERHTNTMKTCIKYFGAQML